MSQVLIEIPEPAKQSVKTADYPNCYAPIPPNGKACVYCGLKHAQLYKLLGEDGAARPYVRVANLKHPGASKGKTVFHVGDMLRYLDWLARHQGSGSEQLGAERAPSAPPENP
jgi:hypothetical protein